MTLPPPVDPPRIRLLISAVALQTAGGLLAWLMTLYTLSLLSLLLGKGIWELTAPLALVTIPLWIYLTRDKGVGETLWSGVLALLLTAAVLGFGFRFAQSYADFSWDGMAYHQEAILQMVGGWSDFPAPLPAGTAYLWQINHYPKAAWIIAASLFKATSSLEGAKLIQLLFFACALLLLLGALLRERQLAFAGAGLVALTAALNPITLYQSQSFYVDGLLASLITAQIALTLLLLRTPRFAYLALFAAVILLAINTKQTGVAYAGLFTLALLGMVLLRQREAFPRVFTAAAIGGLLGALLFGYTPYVTNTVNHGNPFYPVLGQAGVDFEAGQRPPGFDEKSGPSRLIHSTFSAPTLAIQAPANLALPLLSADKAAVQHFIGADIRLGGWGVLFSGALLTGLGGLVLIGKVPTPVRATGLALLATTLLSVLINPEAWWARFAPQWILVALIPGALLLFASTWWARTWGWVTLLLLLSNSALVAYAYYPYQQDVTRKLDNHLQRIAETRRPIQVYFGAFPANRNRLRQAGIRYQAVKHTSELRCSSPHRIFAHEGLFCLFGER